VDEDFAQYVRDRHPQLLRRAYLLTGDVVLAEDLVQDCLARCLVASRRRRIEDLDAYVGRALVHAAVSTWRRRSVVRDGPAAAADRVQTLGQATDDPAESVVDRDRMWRVLQSAPPRQRAVLVLRYYEDLSESVVATLLGVTVGTVRSQNAKGLARMRVVIAGGDPVGGRT
jgi:RNA polymerase sigma-70 factor (sigma-E family)